MHSLVHVHLLCCLPLLQQLAPRGVIGCVSCNKFSHFQAKELSWENPQGKISKVICTLFIRDKSKKEKERHRCVSGNRFVRLCVRRLGISAMTTGRVWDRCHGLSTVLYFYLHTSRTIVSPLRARQLLQCVQYRVPLPGSLAHHRPQRARRGELAADRDAV